MGRLRSNTFPKWNHFGILLMYIINNKGFRGLPPETPHMLSSFLFMVFNGFNQVYVYENVSAIHILKGDITLYDTNVHLSKTEQFY